MHVALNLSLNVGLLVFIFTCWAQAQVGYTGNYMARNLKPVVSGVYGNRFMSAFYSI